MGLLEYKIVKRMFWVALVLAGSSPTLAEEIPRYDPENHCKTVAEFGGSYSAEMYNFCIGQEQEAYNALKARWGAIDARVRKHCDGIARFGGSGSYEMLKFCVGEEERAMSDKKGFSF